MNTELATHILGELRNLGLKEVCVCPGARNAPLVGVLAANSESIRAYYFFEERSAAFFALGRIRSTGNPVAVVTTSGTAAGELLPATMEAYYSGLPLVLLTADRPRSYRGSGAPQTAEQVGLYGCYAPSIDVESTERPALSGVFKSQPLHLNVCFDEPLLEEEVTLNFAKTQTFPKSYFLPTVLADSPREKVTDSAEVRELEKKWNQLTGGIQRPIILVGMVHPEERESVVQLLLQWQAPVYLEALSGLRQDARLQSIRIHSPDRIVERAHFADYTIDAIIRIGGIPTLRLWRDLESKFADLPVFNLSDLPFPGLARPSHPFFSNLKSLCMKLLESPKCFSSKTAEESAQFLELEKKWSFALNRLLVEEPQSEPGLLSALSKGIERDSRIYLGNSLPIREWDLAATAEDRRYQIWGSRGLNGIDGQVSSFLGFAEKGNQNWAVLGDLTALYDLPGPWIVSQLKEFPLHIAVVNNGGGKIFSKMFPLKEFQNQHAIQFKPWADLWGIPYEKWTRVPADLGQREMHRIIEIVPDAEATERFWKLYREIQ